MSIEVERKFLVLSDAYKKDCFKKITIKQGFLNSHKNRVVRVRVTSDSGFITVKGKSNKTGTSRYEWEKQIQVKDAEELLLLCEKTIIEKQRHLVKLNSHIIEVDEFDGANKGLVVAEIELDDENEKFSKPDWLGTEVTGQKKYYNAMLSQKPFSKWVR